MSKNNKSPLLINYLETVAEKDREALLTLKTISEHAADIQRAWNNLHDDKRMSSVSFLNISHYYDGIFGMLIRIGENSLKIDQSIKDANPEVPWDGIKNVRDSLAHMHEQSAAGKIDTLNKLIADNYGIKNLMVGKSQPIVNFCTKYAHSTDNPQVASFTKKIRQLNAMMEMESNFTLKYGAHEIKAVPGDNSKQMVLGYHVNPIHRSAHKRTIDHAMVARYIMAAEHFRSLSDIFKSHHAVVKSGYSSDRAFPDISYMSDARNALAHDFYESFKENKDASTYFTQYDRFRNMRQIIGEKYLQRYNAKKNKLSVTGEGYYDVLFIDKKIPQERVEQFERMVDYFLVHDHRDINKEVTYMQAMLRISSALPAHADFEAVVNETLDFIYDKTVPNKNLMDPSTHPQALQINTVLNRIFRYQNDVSLWSMVGADGAPLGKPAVAKNDAAPLDTDKLDGTVDNPKAVQVHAPSKEVGK